MDGLRLPAGRRRASKALALNAGAETAGGSADLFWSTSVKLDPAVHLILNSV